MCGRYATTRSSLDLSALFEAADETGDGLVPDYNVAPTDPVPVVRISSRGRVLSVASWGLVPPWAADTRGAARMINSRAESAAASRAFAPSLARRRCLVPADGWYEWVAPAAAGRSTAGRKQAYFLTSRDGGPLAFAGLWSSWGSGAARVLTCSILTTAAVGELALVHHRMPLLLGPRRWTGWLTAAGPEAEQLLVAPPDLEDLQLEIRPVGPAVGDVRNDGPELTARVSAPPLTVPMSSPVDLTLF